MGEGYRNSPEFFGRAIENTFGAPIIFVKDLEIEPSALKEKGIDMQEVVSKYGPLEFNCEFELKEDEVTEKLLLNVLYGKAIDALVAKLNGEWKSKIYKV